MEFVGVFLVFSLLVFSVVALAIGLFFLQLCWSWHHVYFR
jgi:hypothetical protein